MRDACLVGQEHGAGPVISSCCTRCAFLPIWLRRVSPPCEGGVVPARAVTRSSLPLSGSSPEVPAPPPLAPPSQGGERVRSLAPPCEGAPHQYASRNYPSLTVNTTLSPLQHGALAPFFVRAQGSP